MKFVIIAGIAAFILSAGITMFITGTFDRNKGEAVDEATQSEQKGKNESNTNSSKVNQNIAKENLASPAKNESAMLKTEVEKYKAEVSAEEAKLTTIKGDIESLKTTKSNVNKYQQLAKLYSSMKAEDAAVVLCELDPSLTEHILSKMNDRIAGKVMGAIAAKDPSYAAKVSKLIANSGNLSGEF